MTAGESRRLRSQSPTSSVRASCPRWCPRAYDGSNFFLTFGESFGKLWEARSRLYRNESLQGNTRWKALDEIYKIYKLLHRSAFKNSAKFRQTFSHFYSSMFKSSLIFRNVCPFFQNVWQNISIFSANLLENIKISLILEFPDFSHRKLYKSSDIYC